MKKNKIDEAFDIEPYNPKNIIDVDDIKSLPSTNIVHDPYDNKDVEIETQYQEVYDKAMEAFECQQDAAEDIEGRFLAKNAEVANQLLSTALSAAKEKANLKSRSDQLQLRKQNPQSTDQSGSTTNIQHNNLIMDRNEILKLIKGE